MTLEAYLVKPLSPPACLSLSNHNNNNNNNNISTNNSNNTCSIDNNSNNSSENDKGNNNANNNNKNNSNSSNKEQEQQQHITFIIANIAMLVLIVMVTESKHAAGIPSQAYHAGRPAKERSQVLEDWNEGRVPVVAATIAFGMGIDRASKYHRFLFLRPAVGFQLWLGNESSDCQTVSWSTQLVPVTWSLHKVKTHPSWDLLCL